MSIAAVFSDHAIPSDLIVNLDQTPLIYLSPGKYRFNLKGAKNIPINGVYDKKQVTATISVSATRNFLPVQLIYTGKIKRCLPNVEFSRLFHVVHTENFWSNQLKATEYFEKVIFQYLDQIKENMAYPKSKHRWW